MSSRGFRSTSHLDLAMAYTLQVSHSLVKLKQSLWPSRHVPRKRLIVAAQAIPVHTTRAGAAGAEVLSSSSFLRRTFLHQRRSKLLEKFPQQYRPSHLSVQADRLLNITQRYVWFEHIDVLTTLPGQRFPVGRLFIDLRRLILIQLDLWLSPAGFDLPGRWAGFEVHVDT